ncbi:MAG: HlyD family efflux transporter periplasmic adaptor subunit [Trichlorobacter sp.]|uniref:HlyD family efflux transporter periplasmic adaptor subunit n=1 Tax=Trichlorobacter sp. TaxID=2911007 RepID=UPI002562A5FD|nr:HlyD family efflux transporter periplasmic adaptor subunit [Trichlorobacter sp.]MDK9718685.1 HlyD family efflux transporter periplasmic adaptor subunit [Trichlorobacter sp.]
MNKKIFFILLGAAVVALVAGVVTRRNHTANSGELKLTGTIETTTVAVSFKVPGRLKERLVDEGQQVTAGQIVARLEDDELKDERAVRSADQQAAQAALADLKAGSRQEEIAASVATLARLKAEADRAAQDAVRAEVLFKKEVIPRRELDAARAAKDATAAAVREGDERLKLVKVGPRPDAIKQAQARLEGAVAARSLADTRLSQAVLAAPISGTVMAKHAEPGELLAAGSPVITLVKMDEVWVRAYLPETQMGKVKLGQLVSVSSDTWKGRTYQGTVSFIASEAEFTPRNVQTEAERVKLVYRIKIAIANPKQELKPGMPVDALIATP